KDLRWFNGALNSESSTEHGVSLGQRSARARVQPYEIIGMAHRGHRSFLIQAFLLTNVRVGTQEQLIPMWLDIRIAPHGCANRLRTQLLGERYPNSFNLAISVIGPYPDPESVRQTEEYKLDLAAGLATSHLNFFSGGQQRSADAVKNRSALWPW